MPSLSIRKWENIWWFRSILNMGEGMNDIAESKEEILEEIGKESIIYLSTIDGNIPRVRPVTMVRSGSRYFIMTGSKDAKVQQIKNNNKIEICHPIKNEKGMGYLRVDGSLDIVKDKQIKKQVAEETGFFKDYWSSPEDPTYTLLEFNMNDFEYLKPGETYARKLL
jgi:general stress protein 26